MESCWPRHLLPPGVDLLALHRQWPERYPYLLESTGDGGGQGQYDVLFACPGSLLELRYPGGLYRDGTRLPSDDFFAELDRWRAELAPLPERPRHAPFAGGWFVFLAYELGSVIEPSVPYRQDPRLPLALAHRCPCALVRERVTGETYFVGEESVASQWRTVTDDLHALVPMPDTSAGAALPQGEPAVWFTEAVVRTQAYIAAGDLFQVNLSRGWSVQTEDAAWTIYRRVRSTNPGAFAGLARIGSVSIISSSPERLVRIQGEEVTVRPIAGTFPRGSAGKERTEAAALRAHPKERAEHVMLVDLARNDLGRICVPGTVRVRSFMEVETYRYVHHLVSEVAGGLFTPVQAAQVMAAVFPGGTITGCPKVRAMQLIREIEPEPRGVYTGSMGYLGRDGDLDLNILIRTLLQEPGRVEIRAGAGIVADSVPDREVLETQAKAQGMLAAVGAGTGLPA